MTFFRFLKGIGDRLGIFETVPGSESSPVPRAQTRTVSLKELAGEIRSGAVRDLADSPAELSVPVEKIFEAAGISAKPGEWTVDRLKQFIEKESVGKESREALQKTLLEHLTSQGVAPETIVKDAIARDQALDAFEARVSEKMAGRTQACKERMREIELLRKELLEESAGLEARLAANAAKWQEWKKAKRARERELASLVSYLVDRPVITSEDEPE